MKIRNIKSFKAFDLVHWKSKGVHTLVSLDLDGRRYYSIVLDGIRDVSSSEDVTVAFEDDEENAVLAWKDQKSREFFHVGGSSSLFACFCVFFASRCFWRNSPVCWRRRHHFQASGLSPYCCLPASWSPECICGAVSSNLQCGPTWKTEP